ncbi:MAG: type 4a pilus biogenesis protein PilO [Patescibacteria group bacterium]|nr:type 4a pilus biogenesis protein PilO [Patescibacteria group bacterium]
MKKSSTFLNLLSVVLLVAVVLGFVFYVNPLSQDVESLNADLEGKTAEVEDLIARVAELEGLSEELGASGVTEERLLLQVPEGESQDELLSDLADLAAEAGVDLNGVNFSNVEGDNSGVINMSASFDGNYEDLIIFLEALEGNTRKIKVNSISVQLSEEGSGAHASFGLTMEAYYQ